MATRRVVSSEKGVLDKDDVDFKPKDGGKSDIGPAVPAYVSHRSHMRLFSNAYVDM
jgi:hypothetical protein